MVEGKNVFQGVSIVELRGEMPRQIERLTCDSRTTGPGDLFVALRGSQFDGHRFLPDVAHQGACAAVVEECSDVALTQVRVADTLAALPKISANFYGYPASELYLAGVTGSNGKTTSTYLMESIWNAAGESAGVLGTIEYRYGGQRFDAKNTTPLPHELHEHLRRMVEARVHRVVLEVSSHGLALHRVDEIQFDTALFTNLSQDHLDFHPSMEAYRETKKRLFTEHLKASGTAILNLDDAAGRIYVQELKNRSLLTYALDRPADVMAREIDLQREGTTFVLDLPGEDVPIRTPLLGLHNVYNILGVAAMAVAQRLTPACIQRGIERMTAVPGRLEPVQSSIGAQVVVDYCHTPDALQKCLELLKVLPHKRIITLFGCGGDRDPKKRPLMGGIALQHSDWVIVTSDNPRTEDPQKILRDILVGMQEEQDRYMVIPDRRAAIQAGVQALREGDIFLIAGKGHETYQLVGREKLPFDDRVVARQCLVEAGKG